MSVDARICIDKTPVKGNLTDKFTFKDVDYWITGLL
jgi:hypothetical protein